MCPPLVTTSTAERGSITHTQCSDPDPTPSTSEPDDCDISNYPIPFSNRAPSAFLRLYKGSDIDREWLMSLNHLRQHARLEEVVEPEVRSFHSRQIGILFRIKRYSDEFQHIVDYISEGDYPIFYTESNGFDVPKYFRVRRCAAYYGVKGLVDWIDGEKYRQIVHKVYENNSASFNPHLRGEMPADHNPSPFGDRSCFIGWRTVWKTELLVEKRDQNGIPVRER